MNLGHRFSDQFGWPGYGQDKDLRSHLSRPCVHGPPFNNDLQCVRRHHSTSVSCIVAQLDLRREFFAGTYRTAPEDNGAIIDGG